MTAGPADLPVRPAMVGYAVGCLLFGMVALGLLAVTSTGPVASLSYALGIGLVGGLLLAIAGRRDQRRHLGEVASSPPPPSEHQRSDAAATRHGILSSVRLALAYAVFVLGVWALDAGNPFGAPAIILLAFGLSQLLQERGLRSWEQHHDAVLHNATRERWWQWPRFLDRRRWVLVPSSRAGDRVA